MKPFDPETFGNLNAHDYDARNDPGTTEAEVALIRTLPVVAACWNLRSALGGSPSRWLRPGWTLPASRRLRRW